jgi:DnaJ domain
MSTLYQILGLSPGANEQQIKSAYRTLAKQFHPDANAGDEASAEHFKKVHGAYETLGDPEAKVAYDRALACRGVENRRRYWTFSVTVAVNIVLITASVSLAVRWSQQAAAPQTERPPAVGMEKSPQAPAEHAATPQPELPPASAIEKSRQAPVEHAAKPEPELPPASGFEKSPRAPAGHAAARQLELPRVEAAKTLPRGGDERRKVSNWTTYQDAHFGFALKYPMDVFVVDKGPTNDNVRTFLSRDGQALLRIFAAQTAPACRSPSIASRSSNSATLASCSTVRHSADFGSCCPGPAKR